MIEFLSNNLDTFQGLVYIIASILFILGIKMLGKEATAVRGNYLSATAMFLAVAITCINLKIDPMIILSAILLIPAIRQTQKNTQKN